MSTQVLDYLLASNSSPADVGNCGMDHEFLSEINQGSAQDTTVEAADNATYGGGKLLWSYTVPDGQQLTMKSLIHVASHAVQAGNLPSGVGAYVEAGVVKMRKNSTTFFEQRWHAPNLYGPTPDNSGGGCPAAFMDHMPAATFNIGGKTGITFVGNTDTVDIVVTPNLGDTGIGWFVTCFGKQGTTPDIRTGFAGLDGGAADTTIFTYAPTSDWKLHTVKISCLTAGSVIMSQMRMTVNGQTVFVCPKICHNQWSADANPLWLNMWGIKFQPGDVIALYGHPILNMRHLLSTTMVGKLDIINPRQVVGVGGSIVRLS